MKTKTLLNLSLIMFLIVSCIQTNKIYKCKPCKNDDVLKIKYYNRYIIISKKSLHRKKLIREVKKNNYDVKNIDSILKCSNTIIYYENLNFKKKQILSRAIQLEVRHRRSCFYKDSTFLTKMNLTYKIVRERTFKDYLLVDSNNTIIVHIKSKGGFRDVNKIIGAPPY